MNATRSRPGGPASVLVIDDESEVRLLLEHLLDGDEFEPTTAESGREALDYLADAEERPDIVLLDIAMPDMDGFEVLRRIRAIGDAPEVVVLSAQDREEAKLRAFELGAVDYVTKPFSTAVLEARLKRHLERARAECDPFPGPWVRATKLAE
jgi:DNA-binding response OmpR family regulator